MQVSRGFICQHGELTGVPHCSRFARIEAQIVPEPIMAGKPGKLTVC
jgi:hypothetical protein